MWISGFRIINAKGFADTGEVCLARGINLIVGPNNAGKSTILLGLNNLQNPKSLGQTDVRKRASNLEIRLYMDGLSEKFKLIGVSPSLLDSRGLHPEFRRYIRINQQAQVGNPGITLVQPTPNGQDHYTQIGFVPDTQPDNFIFPYSAKRKVMAYRVDMGEGQAEAVRDDLTLLPAKIDRINHPDHSRYEDFAAACQDILNLRVGTFPSGNGKHAGLNVSDSEHISLDAMGEGVGHLLGLIINLCMADNNLFLIEEIENDIHPRSLKALLRLIIKKSVNNQFVLSTHSNIVTKYLGAEAGSKVFYVEMELCDRLPTSSIREIGNTVEDRRAILEDLGYELDDYELGKGWLILEESSAETIIKRHLIPWFAPKLEGKLRTIAAGGIGNVGPKFEDFNRLFLFTHLEEMYRNRAWVVVDGDEVGKAAIAKLQQTYALKWGANHFRTFTQPYLEAYYPLQFADKVSTAMATPEQHRRKAKRDLLEEVLAWIAADEETAKAAFEESAAEIIGLLQEIEIAIG